MANLPTDVVNEALDAVGAGYSLGDIEDGSDAAQVALRQYWQCHLHMLRGANWDFARKTAPLTLLADRTGNTADVGTQVPIPWIYEYAYPTDCARVRFIPWNWANQASDIPSGNIQASDPDVPQTTGIGGSFLRTPIRPAKFVIATDPNYPPQQGQNYWDVQGVSPQGRTVILTNVRYAQCVYTAVMLYPSVWDPMYRQALVAYLASQMCMPVWAKKGDVKMGRQLRADQIAIAKQRITEARAMNGNEGTFSSDLQVDWINGRATGGSPYNWSGYAGYGGGDPFGGAYGGGWDAVSFGDGTAY